MGCPSAPTHHAFHCGSASCDRITKASSLTWTGTVHSSGRAEWTSSGSAAPRIARSSRTSPDQVSNVVATPSDFAGTSHAEQAEQEPRDRECS